MLKLSRLALALAALFYAPTAFAQSTIESPPGSGQRFQGVELINPATGQPYAAGPSSSGSAASQTATNNSDGQATNATNQQAIVFPYIFNGTTYDRLRGTGGSLFSTIYQGGAVVSATNPLFEQLTAGSAIIGKIDIDQTTPGTTDAVTIKGSGNTPMSQTTSGALQPPTAASGKIVTTVTALAASTSTQIAPANTSAIGIEVQCDGLAVVAIDRAGGTLTSAAGAGATSPFILPAGSYPLYTMPVATQTAITAYTGTAQTCRVTAYNR